MSSPKLVQRTLAPLVELDLYGEHEEVVETGGIVFSDGRSLSLIKDDAGNLRLLDSAKKKSAQRIKYGRRTYVPPIIDPSLAAALTLATRRVSASIAEIFANICALFREFGVSEKIAKGLTYWALSTWFTDLYPVAPCLVLTGPRTEGRLILQLLACIVRHGLPLADITLSGLRSLPMHIRPTLLIGQPSPSVWKVLSATMYPRAYLPMRNQLADVFCATGVYVGTHLVDGSLDHAFHLHLASFTGNLPVLSDLAQRKLVEGFQPALLDYRAKHASEVRDSNCDFPDLPSELRVIGRLLGSTILDAPELRIGLVSLLQEYRDEIRAGDAFNGESIVVEALLSHCHRDDPDQLLLVGQLAGIANSILKNRGSREKLGPKALGCILRNSLGLTPKRNSKGFAIRLTADVRRRIHHLARDFQVLAIDEAGAGCSQCEEMFAFGGANEKLEQGTEQIETSTA